MLDNVGRILSSFTNISMTDDKCLVDIHIVTLKVTVVVANQSSAVLAPGQLCPQTKTSCSETSNLVVVNSHSFL